MKTEAVICVIDLTAGRKHDGVVESLGLRLGRWSIGKRKACPCRSPKLQPDHSLCMQSLVTAWKSLSLNFISTSAVTPSGAVTDINAEIEHATGLERCVGML